jgi:hypothetical protein
MARHQRGPGMRRQQRRRARIHAAQNAQNNGNGNGALRTRIGRPPGMPEVCRRYLARQAVGLLPTESIDTEEG